MDVKYMRFGDYIKYKRQQDDRQLTMRDVAKVLGISVSMLSEIEHGRRSPFDSEGIEAFSRYLHLSDSEKGRMYDLAANERGRIPSDIDDLMMRTDVGDMARLALRLTNQGVADEADWKQFIRELEKKRRRIS